MKSQLTFKTWVLGVCALLVLFDLALLVTDSRILLSEQLVKPGEHFVVEDWGDLGKAAQAQLACRYFTGRAVKFNVFWYSASNVMGRDSCPFLWRVVE